MDRTLYLKKCQKYAIDKETQIIFDNIKYYPIGYLIQFDEKGNAVNIAMLKDFNKNSIMYAELEMVKE